ncbi:hypothetical protein ARMSODRAFT_981734 [Armillaria solidipes]|uniref:Uncharacterized protein n=1 Tax=Armillaria solidipes TaxID=1076256 RepID=A0A2H3B9C3_9AGAR|nr:hypothetical protein ARMSODRAFT_981734 [Armillaria solidipes]
MQYLNSERSKYYCIFGAASYIVSLQASYLESLTIGIGILADDSGVVDMQFSRAFREKDLVRNYKGTSGNLSFNDGRVGAVIPQERFFITSILMDQDPTPKPSDVGHPYREYGVYWRDVNTEIDIQWNKSVVRGIGRLNREFRQSLLQRLSSVTTDSFNIRVMVATAQRFWLELVGALDYMEIYKPIMDGHAERSLNHRLDRLMGSFTSDISTVQFLIRAGIPVYFVRPLMVFDNQIIERVVELSQPMLTITRPDPVYPVVYTGDPTDAKKYRAIHTCLRQFQCYKLPFSFKAVISTPFEQADSVASTSTVLSPSLPPRSGPVRGAKAATGRLQKGAPMFRRKKQKKSANPALAVRDKFEDLSGMYAPPPIPAWADVNRRINQDSVLSACRVSDEHDNHYFFPDPGLVTFSNTIRQNSYLRQLDHCFDLLQPTEQSTQCSRNFAAMEEMLGSCMQAQGVTMELLAPPADIEEPFDYRRGQELVWRLCELNFRFELLALDTRITRPPPPTEGQTIDSVAADFRLQRQELILTLFPGGALTSVSPSTVGEGLASADWGNRYQRLRIL